MSNCLSPATADRKTEDHQQQKPNNRLIKGHCRFEDLRQIKIGKHLGSTLAYLYPPPPCRRRRPCAQEGPGGLAISESPLARGGGKTESSPAPLDLLIHARH